MTMPKFFLYFSFAVLAISERHALAQIEDFYRNTFQPILLSEQVSNNQAKLTQIGRTFDESIQKDRYELVKREEEGRTLSLEKPSNSSTIVLFSKHKDDFSGFQERIWDFSISAEKDFSGIESLVSKLEFINLEDGSPPVDQRRVLTAWFRYRFNRLENFLTNAPSADCNNRERVSSFFEPIDDKKFVVFYSRLRFVEFDSEPSGAKITISGSNGWNTTRDSGYLPEGIAKVGLSKDGFEPFEVEAKITNEKKNTFTYKLNPKK
ncbi:MAG: PEGA domain-containing protein [Pirellulaceae bacterium]|nr:PEGA domain-containing protein [Pirellulaceae bacterium]